MTIMLDDNHGRYRDANVPRCGSRHGGFKGCKVAVRLRNAKARRGVRNVRVRTRLRSRPYRARGVWLRLRRRLQTARLRSFQKPPLELASRVFRRRRVLGRVPFGLLEACRHVALLLLQLHRRRLVHGQLRDHGHHAPRRVADLRLISVDLPGQVERLAATGCRAVLQFRGEVGDFLQDELVLQQGLLFGVQPLLQHGRLGRQRVSIGVVARQGAPPRQIRRRLQIRAQLLRRRPR
mmetsp:Transcript_26651/g.89698  ORF Transcript_26651/g.89698 Transcript_26651/m.89698 type:complete len:236 (-) Transcript_26651:2082-2789(-)